VPEFNYINERTGGNEHLCSRITEILQLEHQLDHLAEQTFYFKKGLKSQEDKLNVLTIKFETFRNNVNEISSEELAASLSIEAKKLSEVDILNCSRRSRAMARSIGKNRVKNIECYQSIKRDIGVIPELNFFRNDGE